jgi:glycosyltransferase involved in cell wall biosynthesis
MSAPTLLFCSPVLPALGGNGLAMRAGSVLRALASRYRVSLLVIPLYWSPASELPAEIADCCREVTVVTAWELDPRVTRKDDPPRGRLAAIASAFRRPPRSCRTTFADAPFDVIHIFRLALADRAKDWLGETAAHPAWHLDLDDIESSTHERLAELYERTGRPALAASERQAAGVAWAAEEHARRTFDRLYVCSEGDRKALEARRGAGARATVEVLPNSLAVSDRLPVPRENLPFTLLFVGTLGYAPNEDAIVWFCRDVLPRLRRMSPRLFRVHIVGTGASPAVDELAALPEVIVLGAVPSVDACYSEAHAVVVPVRAGGGTRIKILEAFAFGRPVVTTTVGAEGIDALPDEHLLLGDTAADFARQCARLILSQDLGDRLADRAERLFRQRYSLDALIERVKALP